MGYVLRFLRSSLDVWGGFGDEWGLEGIGDRAEGTRRGSVGRKRVVKRLVEWISRKDRVQQVCYHYWMTRVVVPRAQSNDIVSYSMHSDYVEV